MLYNTLYNGLKIDELLEAIRRIKFVINGWVEFESNEESPIDLNKIVNPGNFSMMYWINGPDDHIFDAPIKVIVTKEHDRIRQYIFSIGFNGDGYYREYNPLTTEFSKWFNANLIKGITVSDTPPENPNSNDIWINTNNQDSIIQYYDSNISNWVSLNPFDYMYDSTYNPNNINFQNIYAYIDNNLEEYQSFSTHMSDSSIHISSKEKTYYETKMRSDTLIDAIQIISDELKKYINEKSAESSPKFSAIKQLITNLSSSLSAHINNASIHPTQSQIDNWNNKSNKEHTHLLDGNVTIDTANVKNILSIDQIPDEAKERMIVVNNKDEMLSLTKNDVQDGDWVFINNSEYPLLFVVSDSTKIGSLDGFTQFTPDKQNLSWDNIEDKPTTIEELGITDTIDNNEVDEKVTSVENKISPVISAVDVISNKINYSNNERIRKSHDLETKIDTSDYKLNALYNITILPEDIVNKLETILQ